MTAHSTMIELSAFGNSHNGVDELPEAVVNAVPAAMRATVKTFAAEIRAGRRKGSIWTQYSSDDTKFWKQLQRELIGNNFTSRDIRQHKAQLLEYLRILRDAVQLDKIVPSQQLDIVPEKESKLTERSLIANPTSIIAESSEAQFDASGQLSPLGQKLITYEKLPDEELNFCMIQVSLPTGWKLIVDTPRQRPMFLDTLAGPGECHLFRFPPCCEVFPDTALLPGWRKIVTFQGRIFWQHENSGFITYNTPKRDLNLRLGTDSRCFACVVREYIVAGEKPRMASRREDVSLTDKDFRDPSSWQLVLDFNEEKACQMTPAAMRSRSTVFDDGQVAVTGIKSCCECSPMLQDRRRLAFRSSSLCCEWQSIKWSTELQRNNPCFVESLRWWSQASRLTDAERGERRSVLHQHFRTG